MCISFSIFILRGMVGVGIWLECFKWKKSKDNFVFVVEDVEELTTEVLNQVSHQHVLLGSSI